MLKTAPNPIDVQDFQFKLRCRLKVFDKLEDSALGQHCSLIACASRFGLIFIGSNSSNFQVIQLKNLEEYTKSDGDKANYPRRNIPLPSTPKFLSTNCEHTVLAVVIERNSCPCALFYDIKSFWQEKVKQIEEIRLTATPGVQIIDVNWNPTLGAIFTACKSDGSLGVYELKTPGVDINELPAAANATCFCWSPKGKQIAVGSRDGKITQYKPDLKAVKVINAPPLKEPHSLIALQWVSNYQFIGIFQSSANQPSLIVVDAPKTGDCTYVNYDDICYSNGASRVPQFYTLFQTNWNILMVASSNSMEVGVLSYIGESWTQWILGDSARAELPLSADHQDTLPVGAALDIGCTQNVQWGETQLPPAPIFLLLSHYGTLCCFNVINLKEGAPSICTPPDPIADTSGQSLFVSKVEREVAPPPPPQTTQPVINVPKFTSSQSKVTPPPFGGQTKVERGEITPPPTQPVTRSQTLFGGQVTLTPVTPETPKSLPNKSESLLSAANLKAEEEATETLFAQMIKDECVFLEAELKALLHQGKSLKINLGSDEDKIKIIESTKVLEDFFKEVVETCKVQDSEVHILKQNLLQSWAWYEEINSLHSASQDTLMAILLKAKPLDSLSEKQLADIRHANYYLESQIAQAHRSLDEQWENFQDYCKKNHKMKLPTMELIFQTMVKQNVILSKQSVILKDIASRIKSKARSSVGPSLLRSFTNIEDLPEEMKKLRMDPDDIYQLQLERAENRQKLLTPTKMNALRNLLLKREPTRIKPQKPELSTTSIIQTSPLKLKQFNNVEVKVPSVSRQTDFRENTTKLAPLEGLQNFGMKFDTQNFAPFTKNVIAGSPNSAFVSTTFNAIASTSTPVPAAFKPVNFTASTSSTNATMPTFEVITTVPSTNQPIITISSNNPPLSKSFTFSGTTQITKAATSTPTPKSTFTFNFQTVTSPQASVAPVSTKPTSVPTSLFTFTTPTKASASTNDAVTINSTMPSFSLGGTTSIFKSTTTSNDVTSTTTKPFTFGPVTVAKTVVTTSSVSSSVPPKTGAQTSATSTPASSTKQSIFGIFTTPSTMQSSIFGTGSTQSSIFASGDGKPLFGTIPQTITSTVTTTSSTTPSTPPTTASFTSGFKFSSTPSNKPLIFVTSTETSTTKPTIFGTSTENTATNNSIFGTSSETIVTKLEIFGTSTESSTTKPVIFGTTAEAIPAKPLTFATGTEVNTTKHSIFGTNTEASTTKPSIFGTKTEASTTKSAIFGTNTDSTTIKSSIFGTSTEASTTKSSIFSNNADSSTTKPTIFGTNTVTSTVKSPIFGTITETNSTKPSIFGISTDTASSKPSIFGASTATGTTKSSILGTNVETSTTKPSIFPSTTETTTSKPSIFGTSTTATEATTTSTQIFATNASETTTSKPSLFGISTEASTLSNPAATFSNTTTTVSIATSVFGTSIITTTNSPPFSPATTIGSIFGTTPASTQASIFGSSAAAPAPTQSQNFGLFGSTTQNQNTIFCASNAITPTSQTPSIFGAGGTQSSVFGGLAAAVPSTTAQSLPFGQTQSSFDPPKSTQSIFGQTPSFGSTNSTFGGSFGSSTGSGFGQSTSTSIFGTQPAATTGSIFGGTPTASSAFGSGTSIFGSPTVSTPSPFGSANVFASTAPQPSSFATNTNTGSFGFGTLNVGSGQSSSSTGFGTNPPAAHPFGGTTATSSFGSSSNTGSIFGNSTSQGFGSGYGTQTSIFGQQQTTFGQSGTFGGGTATFGQPTPGPFSAGSSGTVAQSGFGASPNFQKPTGFGSSSVFGGTPAFGSTPSFGGAPAFGTSASFSSPPKIFGSGGGGAATFGGAGAAQSTGFGNLANQPTVGFGNLAQQASSTPTQNAPFTGNSSFSSWR